MLMDLKDLISTQEDFADIAQVHSDCGSARSGGDLGEFGDGQMMKVQYLVQSTFDTINSTVIILRLRLIMKINLPN